MIAVTVTLAEFDALRLTSATQDLEARAVATTVPAWVCELESSRRISFSHDLIFRIDKEGRLFQVMLTLPLTLQKVKLDVDIRNAEVGNVRLSAPIVDRLGQLDEDVSIAQSQSGVLAAWIGAGWNADRLVTVGPNVALASKGGLLAGVLIWRLDN